jgi:hypothetical protein
VNCPEHLVFGKGGLWIWLYYRDVPRHKIPLRVWLNPLRYQVIFARNGKRLLILNRDGMCWGRVKWLFIRKWRALFGQTP